MKTFRTPIAGIEDDVTRMTRESTEVEKMTIKLQQMKASLITARIKASIVAAKMANRCDRLTSLDGLMRSHTGSSPWLTGTQYTYHTDTTHTTKTLWTQWSLCFSSRLYKFFYCFPLSLYHFVSFSSLSITLFFSPSLLSLSLSDLICTLTTCLILLLKGGADRRPMWEKHGKRLQTVTSARALSWSLSLDDLLADPLGVALLREFVTAEYSAESLSFYLEHIKFQKLETSALNDAAKTLFNRFVVSGADEEVTTHRKT